MSYQLDPTASLEANLVVGQPIEVRDSASRMGGLIFIPDAPFVLKVGQGLRLSQGAIASVDNIAFEIVLEGKP